MENQKEFFPYVNIKTGMIRYFDDGVPEEQKPEEWKKITEEEYLLFFKVVDYFVPVRLGMYVDILKRDNKRRYDNENNE